MPTTRIDFVVSPREVTVSPNAILELLKQLKNPTYDLIFAENTDAAMNLTAVMRFMSQGAAAHEIRSIPILPNNGGALAGVEIGDAAWNFIWADIEAAFQPATEFAGQVLIVAEDGEFITDLAHLVASTGPNDPFFTGLSLRPYTAISINVDSGRVAVGEPTPVGWQHAG